MLQIVNKHLGCKVVRQFRDQIDFVEYVNSLLDNQVKAAYFSFSDELVAVIVDGKEYPQFAGRKVQDIVDALCTARKKAS